MISIANLTFGSAATNGSTQSTASITPSANKLLLLSVDSRTSITANPNIPTVTGNGLTWVQVNTVVWDTTGSSRKRKTIFRAFGTPTAGAISINFGGQVQAHVFWVVDEVSGAVSGGVDGSAAIIQSATFFQDATTSSSITVTLNPFANANNATYASFSENLTANVVFTPKAGFTSLATTPALQGQSNTIYKNSGDTTPSVSLSSAANEVGAIGIEIANPQATLIGTATSDNTNTGFLSGLANSIGTSNSTNTNTGFLSGLANTIGTSTSTSTLFDSLLINNTDVLLIDASNNSLATPATITNTSDNTGFLSGLANSIGTSNNTSDNTGFLSGLANSIGTAISVATISSALILTGSSIFDLVGTSAPNFGSTTLFDSLLINNTDVLLIDASNNSLATSATITTNNLTINSQLDTLLVNGNGDLLDIIQNQSTENALLSNSIDSLYINSSDNTLIVGNQSVSTGNTPSANENPSFGRMIYSVDYNGQSASSTSAFSEFKYSVDYIGLSKSSILSMEDSLLVNATDLLYTDAFNDTLGIVPSAITTSNDLLLINNVDSLYIDASNNTLGLNSATVAFENFSKMDARYNAKGTSTSNSSVFYIAQGSTISIVGQSITSNSGSGVARYTSRYVGESDSVNNNIGSSIYSATLTGTANSTATSSSNASYSASIVGQSDSITSSSANIDGKYGGIGYAYTFAFGEAVGEYTYRSRGNSVSINTNNTKIIGTTNQIGNSNLSSTVLGNTSYSNLLVGESISNTTADSTFNYLAEFLGLSESYTTITSNTDFAISLSGFTYSGSDGLGAITGTYDTMGVSQSTNLGNGVVTAKASSIGLSSSISSITANLSALYKTKGSSSSTSSANAKPNYKSFFAGTSVSNSIANAISYIEINYTGTSTSNTNINSSMVASMKSRGISTSTNNIVSTFKYSFMASGESISVNVNTARLTGSYKLVGSSYSNNTGNSSIRLSGLTSPADQAYLNELLLNSPNSTISALKESTYIVLDKNEFV